MPEAKLASDMNLSVNRDRFRVLDALIDSFIEKNVKQYFVVRAHRNGIPIYEYAAGENDKPYGLQQDSITPVFSCSKPITAVLIMKLQEDGLLDVCDPVVQYLPWLGNDKKEILIWHLLSHTSGIIDDEFFAFSADFCEKSYGLTKPEDKATEKEWKKYHTQMKEKIGLPKNATEDDVTHFFLTRFPLKKKPHEVMSYGMTAFNLLGDIIQEVVGKNIDDYAREALFEPLGMKDSHFIVPKKKYDQVIGRKKGTNGYPWINSPNCMNNIHAQNGLKTSVADLCRFCDMILSQGQLDDTIILSPASIREMSDNHNFDLPAWDSWGLGWNVRGKKKDSAGILRSDISLEHGGWAGCKMLCDPKYDLSLAIFSGEWKESTKSGLNNIINVIYSALR